MDRGPASWEAERRPTNIGDLKSLLSSLNAIEASGVAALQGKKLIAVDVSAAKNPGPRYVVDPQPTRKELKKTRERMMAVSIRTWARKSRTRDRSRIRNGQKGKRREKIREIKENRIRDKKGTKPYCREQQKFCSTS